MSNTTIVAIATPHGFGGIGIIRISGPKVVNIINKFLKKPLSPRMATNCTFYNRHNEHLDHGIAIYFPSPNSFTGEDILELQGHGGPIIMDLIIREAVFYGAELAKPGEFSERAFLNDKIDLIQAEAIAELIQANSASAAKAAMCSLRGDFSKKINDIVNMLISLRTYIEAAIDFAEEEIELLSNNKILTAITKINTAIVNIMDNAKQGILLNEGIKIVLTGKPNVGKSSLLNLWAEDDRAIVTNIPGTTRDSIKENLQLEGINVQLVDTAGIRDTPNLIEAAGIKRALKEIASADLILNVVDCNESIKNYSPSKTPMITIRNKIDITPIKPGVIKNNNGYIVNISAKTRAGFDDLLECIKNIIGIKDINKDKIFARRRHLEALQQAKEFILSGEVQIKKYHARELLAEELRKAQQSLEEITGRFTSDDLLGKIFSEFCIGK